MTTTVRAAGLALAAVAPLAAAQIAVLPTANLIVNAGAEAGDMSGWTSAGIEAVLPDAPAAGFGRFSFTGGFGAAVQSASQRIALDDFATLIDAGAAVASMEAWIQSRSGGLVNDIGTVSFEFLDQAGAVLAQRSFTDPATIGFDWDFYTDDLRLPVGVREARVTMTATRNGGSTTDAFFDDLSLVLVPAPSAAGAAVLGGLIGARRRR